MVLRVKDAYGINEPLLKILARNDTTWDTAFQIWLKAKALRFDSLTQEQMTCLEAIELDLQEQEQMYVMKMLS